MAPTRPQKTFKGSSRFAGIGLHSGHRVEMTFHPAPPNSGIAFQRSDLEGKPLIEAKWENVNETNRSTTLSKGNIKVHTVEHILATLHGFGIDNAIIELNANEPPIGDGSARPYLQMVEEAEIVEQSEVKSPYVITEPFSFQIGESWMSVFPQDHLSISCTSADQKGRFTQFFQTPITQETWTQEIAHARTFCFFEEIEMLIKTGLIKGGSLENAIIIRDDAVLTTEPLRYPDEFVRHKILDILGDLYLLGRSIVGHIVAVKPSHAANCELVRQLHAQMRKPLVAAQTFTPPPPPPASTTSESLVVATPPSKPSEQTSAAISFPVADDTGLTVDEIKKYIPHRYPFLMVDRVLQIQEKNILALKNVSINEPYFQGHFPSHPVMPGVLQLEAIAQVAGILMAKHAASAGKLAYFMSAENVKWRKPVRPGDSLIIDVQLTKTRGRICKAEGVCRVGNDIVSEASITFMLVDEA